MKYELAIFDMDGTILNTLEDLMNAINYALRNNGLPTRSMDEVRTFLGNGLSVLVKSSVPADCTAEQITAVTDSFNDYYRVHYADATTAYDGILPLLHKLREAGIRTAVVSNKPDYGVKDLTEFYFSGCFDIAVGEREGIRKKPAPDSVNEVLSKLNINKAAAIYIGDSDVDIATAVNAGIPCISVDWGFRSQEFLKEHGATVIVSNPNELYQMLTETYL